MKKLITLCRVGEWLYVSRLGGGGFLLSICVFMYLFNVCIYLGGWLQY